MNTTKIVKHSVINAVLASAYVAMISQVIRNGEALFGEMKDAYGPMAFLLLFVVSAAVMAIVIFGQPIIWYLDGFKKEGVRLAICTVIALFIITLIILISLAF